MHGSHPIGITRQGLQGGRVIGLQQVPHRDLWRLKVDALRPRSVVLHVAPDPLDGVELGAGGWEPYGLHVCRPSNPWRRMGSTVI